MTTKLPSEYRNHKNLKFYVVPIYETGGPLFWSESDSISETDLFSEFRLNFSRKLSWKGISLINWRDAIWYTWTVPLFVPSKSLSWAVPIFVNITPSFETVLTNSPFWSRIRTFPFSPRIRKKFVSSEIYIEEIFYLIWILFFSWALPCEYSQILTHCLSIVMNGSFVFKYT